MVGWLAGWLVARFALLACLPASLRARALALLLACLHGCLLAFLWLDMLDSWHALDFDKKPIKFIENGTYPREYSNFEVEHDFSKTHVSAVNLKLVCQRPNFARFLNP